MNDGYSIRLGNMKQELTAWAAEYDQKPAWLIKRILAGALQARRAESTQSDLPVSALLRLPKSVVLPASQAESES